MKQLLALLLLIGAMHAGAETWHFGLIGDVPYSDHERRELPRMLDHIADSQVQFIVHVGDFKHGQARCDDALFDDRYRLFDDSRVPFIYIPGDNEWTDCGRLSNGAYDPVERLGRLRTLFWKDKRSLGQRKIELAQQNTAYPEHARFRFGPVLFVALNLPGSHNNIVSSDHPSPEFLARNPVVLEWIDDSFALARREKLAGIVLMFQADPDFKHFAQGLGDRAYQAFLEKLRTETQTFPGEVVVVHGDTHISRIDHPMRDAAGRVLDNLTRVETFGYPLMGWTRATIDTDSPVLFRFEAHPWPEKE